MFSPAPEKRKNRRTNMSFEQFELNDTLRRAVRRQGFEEPTPVQAGAIPPALEGRDVLGVAQTGTGKTIAFLLPSFERLLASPSSRNPRMLVLAPTRELALQIADAGAELAAGSGLKVAVVYGGAPLGKQAEQLRRGVDLVVATPGRLLDHLRRGNLRLSDVQILVLDEADRMLDMGFLPDIRRILTQLPVERQTLLFLSLIHI